MGLLRITNTGSEVLPIAGTGLTIPVGEYREIERTAADLPAMKSLAAAVAAGKASYTWTPSSAELASGLMAVSQSVEAADMAGVAVSDLSAGLVVLRKSFAAGVPGTADDVTLIAAGALPRRMRIVGGHVLVSTGIGGATAQVRDEAAGAGTLAAAFSAAAAGMQPWTGPNATVQLAPGASKGLFLRRSDRGIAGEVILFARYETA